MKRKARKEISYFEGDEEDIPTPKKNPSLMKNISIESKDHDRDSLDSKSLNYSREESTGALDLSQFSFNKKKVKKDTDTAQNKKDFREITVPPTIKKDSDDEKPAPKKKVIFPSKKSQKENKEPSENKAKNSKKTAEVPEKKSKKEIPPKKKSAKSKKEDSSFSEHSKSSAIETEEELVSENDSYKSESEEKSKKKKQPKTNKKSEKSTNPKPKANGKKKSETSQVIYNGNFMGRKEDFGGSKPPYSSNQEDEDSNMIDESLCNPDMKFEMPEFLEEDSLRDAQGRKPKDPDYDPTTLLIPEKYYNRLNYSMKQYWDVKKVNFEKLVAFNMFDFYWFYYHDALIVAKILDMKISALKNGKIYCCMACKQFRSHVTTLLDQGYKIVMVERTSDKFEIFEKKKTISKNEELVRREVCQVLTRGTYIDHAELDYSSRYALCVFEHTLKFGIVFLDTTTQEFHLGEFEDDVNRTHFRTILTRIKPIEVIFYNEYISPETLNIIKNLSTKPTQTPLTLIKPKAFDVIFHNLSKYKKELPKILQEIKTSIEATLQSTNTKFDNTKYFLTCQSLSLCLEYLEEILLAETVFAMGEFYNYDDTIQKKGSLYLDSQALENLEILDIGYINLLSESYSLFGFMDNTATAYGKRMFKKWITGPLLDPVQIAARMEAVDDLMLHPEIAECFQDRIRKLPDIERTINRIYNLTDKKRMMTNHMEEFAFNRLKDFMNFLPELRKVEDIMLLFEKYIPKFKSERLRQLCTLKDVDVESIKNKTKETKKSSSIGLFPKIAHLIDDLEKMVTIKEGVLMPAPGICKEMDRVVEKTDAVKEKLNKILDNIRKMFKSNEIVYVNSRRRFELEFPETLIDNAKRPKDFIITSKRKGYLRYQTPEIEELAEKLVPLDYEFQKEIIPFIVDYFKLFYSRNAHWRQVILCLSELDCLCSLAKFAKKLPVKCKPVIYPVSQNVKFELKDMIHPMAARNNPNFVSNSFKLDHPIFLITGPNMGGKSTFLRMVCIAVVMAQMGSYVPAESFKFTAVDRIFTRIGASDRITEGKSTFFVEMEETFNIVSQATKNSLVILDELGRGTSTYDGVSIAYATLKYISEKINCITLFATHYHFLIEEFSVYENIKTYCMESEFDEKKEEIKFKYKFVPGRADRSHGIVMGKMAGLPQSVISSAKEKEKFMTQEKRNISFEKNLMEKFTKAITELHHFDEGSYDKKQCLSLLHELESII